MPTLWSLVAPSQPEESLVIQNVHKEISSIVLVMYIYHLPASYTTVAPFRPQTNYEATDLLRRALYQDKEAK